MRIAFLPAVFVLCLGTGCSGNGSPTAPAAQPTVAPSASPLSATPTPIASPSKAASAAPSVSASALPAGTPSAVPSAIPSANASPSPSPSLSPTPPSPSQSASPSVSPAPSGQSIYVADGTAIKVFSGSATGDVAPLRTISGRGTGLLSISDITVGKDGLLYVADYGTTETPGSIRIFAAGAHGDAPPVRILSGPLTHIRAAAVAVDSDGTLYVGENPYLEPVPLPPSYTIAYFTSSFLRFAPGASGNTAPLASTPVEPVDTLVLDSTGKNLIASGHLPVCCGRDIYTVPRTLAFTAPDYIYDLYKYESASLADDPLAHAYYDVSGEHLDESSHGTEFEGSIPVPLGVLQFACPQVNGLAVDAKRELIVTEPAASQSCAPQIDVYAPDPTGSAPPVRTIAGPHTTLVAPGSVTVGP